MKKIMSIALSLAVLAGCAQKEEMNITVNSDSQKVEITFNLNDPVSKVAFSESDKTKLAWTGEESMTLIFGKYNENGADNKNNPVLHSSAPGVFSGTVEIPAGFTIDDLQGIVVPSENEAFYDFDSWDATDSKAKASIHMYTPTEQIQTETGKPNFAYAPFFCDLSAVAKTYGQDGKYSFSELTLSPGASMLEVSVFGAEEGETLQSVEITVTSDGVSGDNKFYFGTTDRRCTTGSAKSVKVTLEKGVAIPTATSGVKTGACVYLSYVARNHRVVKDVTVTTNKRVYKNGMPPTTQINRSTRDGFVVTPVSIDLSNFAAMDEIVYSADGGAWTATLPTTFVSLAVKGALSADGLTAVKTAVDTQTNPVELDLSRCFYESVDFPALFAGTAEAPNTTLKSISFPSNVSKIVESAFIYCEKLKTVGLERITSIGNSAFRYSGLTHLNVSKHVNEFGDYVFADCYDLEEVYFNASDDLFDVPGGSGHNYHAFEFTVDSKKGTHTVDLTFTVGPDSRIPKGGLTSNSNLSTLIFMREAAGGASEGVRNGNNSLIDVKYLSTVITKGNNWVYNGSITNAGVSLPNDTVKYYVVPDGQTETYRAWRMWTGNGDTGALEKMSFTMIEQSAYDALQQ